MQCFTLAVNNEKQLLSLANLHNPLSPRLLATRRGWLINYVTGLAKLVTTAFYNFIFATFVFIAIFEIQMHNHK